MARYASSKHALGISDRSGRAYKITNMLMEWNGYLVGRDEYESKQPQLQPRRVRADPQALKISRPARTEPAVEVLLAFNSFKSSTIGSSVISLVMVEAPEIRLDLEVWKPLMDLQNRP